MKIRRVTAVLLSLMFLLTMLPASVLADNECPQGGQHEWEIITHKATFEKDGFQEGICKKCGENGGMAIGGLAVRTVELEKTSYAYTGKAIKPKVTIANYDGPLPKEYYSVSYSRNKNVGTASVKITLKGDYFEGTKTLKFKITKAANPLAVVGKDATIKYSKLKTANQTLGRSKVIVFEKALDDEKTFKITSAVKGGKSFKSYFKINQSTGRMTITKGLKKGTYEVTVKVKAAGDNNYKASGTKTVTFKVKVS